MINRTSAGIFPKRPKDEEGIVGELEELDASGLLTHANKVLDRKEFLRPGKPRWMLRPSAVIIRKVARNLVS